MASHLLRRRRSANASCACIVTDLATLAAAEAGVGLANLLSYQTATAIAAGRLVRVLADHAPAPLPVSLLFEGGRAAMPAVRLFIEAMKEQARQQAWS